MISGTDMNGDVHDSVIRAAMADLVNAVTGLRQSGHVAMSQSLKGLAENVMSAPIPPHVRHEIIENLVFVGQQALMPRERRKRGVVKAVLGFVKHTTQSVPSLEDTWHTYGLSVENFFSL